MFRFEKWVKLYIHGFQLDEVLPLKKTFSAVKRQFFVNLEFSATSTYRGKVQMLVDVLECPEKLSFTRRCRPWIPQRPEVQCISILEKTWQSSSPGDWETCEELPSHTLPLGSLFLLKPSSVTRVSKHFFPSFGHWAVFFFSRYRAAKAKPHSFDLHWASQQWEKYLAHFAAAFSFLLWETRTTAVLCFAYYVTDKLSESESCLLPFYQSSQPNLGLAFVVRMCMTSIPPRTSII